MNCQEFIKKVTGGIAVSALPFCNPDNHSGFVSVISRITPGYMPDADIGFTAAKKELQVLTGTKTSITSTDSCFLASVHIRKNSVFTHE